MDLHFIGLLLLLLQSILQTISGARLPQSPPTYPGRSQFHGSGPKVDRMMGLEREPCESPNDEFLRRTLGAAFNPRYMSLEPPPDRGDVPDEDRSDPRRGTDGSFRPFSVDDSFAEELESEAPAWEVDHFASDPFGAKGRRRREVNGDDDAIPHPFGIRDKRAPSTPWECKSTIKWLDLGPDYFPRYLRSVECTKHDCWYGRYRCRPKSFTVKLLRRKAGRCASSSRKSGSHGLPRDLRELWVWEERAVNFCCECAAS